LTPGIPGFAPLPGWSRCVDGVVTLAA